MTSQTIVFLSYSSEDHFFAELALIKLAKADITVWRDRDKLLAGADWRQGIERGITDSVAVLVALSPKSASSPYVTYEWAYAMGKSKPIIPLMLAPCSTHPRLAAIQHLSFANSASLPWELLTERIQGIESEGGELETLREPTDNRLPDPDERYLKGILAYLNQSGFQMVSFERLREKFGEELNDERLREMIKRNPDIFRNATLKGEKAGLAKLLP